LNKTSSLKTSNFTFSDWG